MVVKGMLNGDDHAWNVVELDGQWYHIDSARDDFTTSKGWFLVSDNMMEADYRWNTSLIPPCAGGETEGNDKPTPNSTVRLSLAQ